MPDAVPGYGHGPGLYDKRKLAHEIPVVGQGVAVDRPAMGTGQDHGRSVFNVHVLRIVVALEFVDLVTETGNAVRMPVLSRDRLAYQVMVASSRHKEIRTEQRTDQARQPGMEQDLADEFG